MADFIREKSSSFCNSLISNLTDFKAQICTRFEAKSQTSLDSLPDRMVFLYFSVFSRIEQSSFIWKKCVFFTQKHNLNPKNPKPPVPFPCKTQTLESVSPDWEKWRWNLAVQPPTPKNTRRIDPKSKRASRHADVKQFSCPVFPWNIAKPDVPLSWLWYPLPAIKYWIWNTIVWQKS